MKILFLVCLLSQAAFAYELKQGYFHGTGTMSCNFINGSVNRPDALTWEIHKTSDEPSTYEILGGISVINAVPLQITAIENEKGIFNLMNAEGKRKGELKCARNKCQLEFHFMTNFIQNLRIPQVIRTEWTWNKAGFFQTGTLKSILVPYITNCKFEDRLLLVE